MKCKKFDATNLCLRLYICSMACIKENETNVLTGCDLSPPLEWAIARLESVHFLIEAVACKWRDSIAHFVVGKPGLCPFFLGAKTNCRQFWLRV